MLICLPCLSAVALDASFSLKPVFEIFISLKVNTFLFFSIEILVFSLQIVFYVAAKCRKFRSSGPPRYLSSVIVSTNNRCYGNTMGVKIRAILFFTTDLFFGLLRLWQDGRITSLKFLWAATDGRTKHSRSLWFFHTHRSVVVQALTMLSHGTEHLKNKNPFGFPAVESRFWAFCRKVIILFWYWVLRIWSRKGFSFSEWTDLMKKASLSGWYFTNRF